MTFGTTHSPELETLLDYLERSRSIDFTGYKRASLQRRITKRIHEIGISDFTQYIDPLEVHPDEFTILFNTILINVTAFFRDAESWKYLATRFCPACWPENRRRI